MPIERFPGAQKVRERSLFKIILEVENPKVFEEFEALGDNFRAELEKTFKLLVFDINKYLIRVTPIDTGELRGGWTAFLDAEQEDYTKQIFDTSLAIKARNRDFHIGPAGIAKGKQFSTYEFPSPLDFTIINAVPYGFYLEFGTSVMRGRNFVAITRYKGEVRFEAIFNKWFADIAREGRIVPATPDTEEIVP